MGQVCCHHALKHLLLLLPWQVCGAIFRMDSNGNGPGVRYVHEHPEVLFTLFRGYDNPAIALNCGSMLRDCIRDESLAQ